MKLSELHFDLPESQIAQEPCANRDQSRMLVLERLTGHFQDQHFYDFPHYLRAGDVLVLNNTRVFPARLVGTREGFTGRIEVFLVREHAPDTWEALVKPGRRLRVGTQLKFGDGSLQAEIIQHTPDGRRLVRFNTSDVYTVLDVFGQTPLPPYIHRDSPELARFDRESYQTVYARERGAVAAPTAGLHFTPGVLNTLTQQGVEMVELTLHVGYGTFQPVQTENIENHRLEGERFTIADETARVVNLAKREGRRVIAVGTTSTRALESATRKVDSGYEIIAGSGTTSLLIYPGYSFRILDGLLTNFHLPCSSLLALVCAFGGYEPVMAAYRHAVQSGYRFFSYGDCMLLV